MVAEKIAVILNEALLTETDTRHTCVDIYNVMDEPITTMSTYDYLILGIPTWDYGELQEDWENIWDDIDNLDLS
jgi:flavodoxin II